MFLILQIALKAIVPLITITAGATVTLALLTITTNQTNNTNPQSHILTDSPNTSLPIIQPTTNTPILSIQDNKPNTEPTNPTPSKTQQTLKANIDHLTLTTKYLNKDIGYLELKNSQINKKINQTLLALNRAHNPQTLNLQEHYTTLLNQQQTLTSNISEKTTHFNQFNSSLNTDSFYWTSQFDEQNLIKDSLTLLKRIKSNPNIKLSNYPHLSKYTSQTETSLETLLISITKHISQLESDYDIKMITWDSLNKELTLLNNSSKDLDKQITHTLNQLSNPTHSSYIDTLNQQLTSLREQLKINNSLIKDKEEALLTKQSNLDQLTIQLSSNWN